MASSWEIVASSSSSSSSLVVPPQPKYDVFLSFSGIDTRKKFTDHLLAALERRGIYTFRDDTKLDRGEDIKHELPKAIEESRISIVVFSKNYAASEWCLDELVKIMECKKSFQQIVLPIFYDVDPSEVRGLKRSFAEAFSEHQTCKKAEEWRSTLTEVANLSGLVLQNEASGHEAEFIQSIVEEVEKKLNLVHLYVADHPVGMESRIQCVTELLRIESNDTRIVAIWGIGGIGKTTIAKAVYNHFHHQFECCSFIADVRKTSNMPHGLFLLQKLLLSDILGNQYLNIGNSHQGIEVIKRRVFCRKLLLVLDDVDRVDQLKALAIDQKFLNPGSRIIITTRDISSLNSLKIVDEMYMPKELNKYESLQLFSGHAFKENNPMVDYIELSNEVVHYSRGVPLVLEVLGSFLFKKTKSEWRSAITELKQIPHDDVQKKLKISFDSLSEGRKQLFLDIACFFAGMDRDFTIKILEGCDFHPVIGIRDLANKCLINSLDLTNNRIVMHDVLRDMGKEIVRQECIEEPGRRSRLWDPKDSRQALRDGTGTETIEGLFLNLLEPKRVQANAKDEDFFQNLPEAKYVEADAKAFRKMKRLRLLHLNFVHLTVGLEHISRRLVWLSWKGFSLTCVPSNLSLENLVTLDLSYSKLKKVWKKSKILDKLKFLYLNHCYYLTRTPDFSGLNNLEILLLNDCIRLVEVHESVTHLNKLLVLNMENCRNLMKLPWRILTLKSLECLNLSNCCKLGNFAGFNGSPSRSRAESVNSIGSSLASVQGFSFLKRLHMRKCNLSHIPSEIRNLMSLTRLDLAKNNLHAFPIGICNLTRLETLQLEDCSMSHIPSGIGNLVSLKSLNLSYNNFRTLPDGISNRTCLENLFLRGTNVSHLPNGISSLISLRLLNLGANNLHTFPNGICYLTRLEELYIDDCNLSVLPNEIGCLISLNSLHISGSNLCTLPDTIGNLTRLLTLELESNVSHLPESIGNLTQLVSLHLNNCKMLQSLPVLPASFQSLEAYKCTSLESISMQSNWLHQVEMSFEGCSKLAEPHAAKKFRERLFQYSGLSSLWMPITLRFCYEVVPTCQSIGSCLSLVVPPLVNHKLLGLILCITFTFHDAVFFPEFPCYRISNTSKGLGRVYHPNFPSHNLGDHDETWFSYIPLCYTEIQIGGQDEVEISVIKEEAHQVKHWEVTPVYELDKNNTEANDGSLIKYTSSLTYQPLAEGIGRSSD